MTKNNSNSPPPRNLVAALRPWLSTLGRLAALAAIFGLFALLVPDGRFFETRNLENILVQSSVVAACAIGATMVIISAGIDLSVGSMIAMTVVVTAYVLDIQWEAVDDDGNGLTIYLLEQWPRVLPLLAVLAGLGAAMLAGAANGAMITGLRIVPFVATLGGLQIYRGIAKGIADEQNIYSETTWINTLMDPVSASKDRAWMLLPPGVWITLIGAVLAAAMLRYTRLGRHIFAVGSNEQTARLCGVSVKRTKVLVYLLAGFFAGLGGLLQYSYLGIGQPTTAVGYELFVIAAVVIGGGSLMGGEGTIFGTIIGALIIGILANGGVQMGWPKWVQEIVTGVIIIVAVALDQIRHRRSSA